MTKKNETQEYLNVKEEKRYPRSEIALKYFPSKVPKYACNNLSYTIKRISPKKHKLIYDNNSPIWVSKIYFSESQVHLIDQVMQGNNIYSNKPNIQVYKSYRVKKLRFAKILFPNVLPEVALKRMMLMLEMNFHKLNQIFITKEERYSNWVSLYQAFEIANLFSNKDAIDWILVEAKRQSKKDLFGLEPDWFDDSLTKMIVYEHYTHQTNPNTGRVKFIKLLKGIPGAFEAVYDKPIDKYKRCFTKGQMREIEKYLGK